MIDDGIIIQARLGSTRLFGKILKKINHQQTILDWVVKRCGAALGEDRVFVATTNSSTDNPVETHCIQNHYQCFRGDEHNVLDRYIQCARHFNIHNIIRVTADCPFICPAIIKKCVKRFHQTGSDYLNNSRIEKTFPRGLDVEICTQNTLERIGALAKQPYEQEHVTIYIYEHPDQFKIETVRASPEYFAPQLRLTVDTVDDFNLIERVVQLLANDNVFLETTKIISYLLQHPELTALNSNVEQKPINGKII